MPRIPVALMIVLFAHLYPVTSIYAGHYTGIGDTDTISFTESLARYVSGVIRQDQVPAVEDGKPVDSSVIWIPTYYGYHSFIGVLDNYVHHYTSLTSMVTWRLEERKYWVIYLAGKDVSVRIIYDSLDSLLLLSLPRGY